MGEKAHKIYIWKNTFCQHPNRFIGFTVELCQTFPPTLVPLALSLFIAHTTQFSMHHRSAGFKLSLKTSLLLVYEFMKKVFHPLLLLLTVTNTIELRIPSSVLFAASL